MCAECSAANSACARRTSEFDLAQEGTALPVRGPIGQVGQPGDLACILGHRLQLADDAFGLAVQHVRGVEQVRGRQMAHQRGHGRVLPGGLAQQETRTVHMLDALAGDIAELQRDDRLGDLPADLLRSRADRGDGAGRLAAMSFDRGDAGGEIARDCLHRPGLALGEAVRAGPRGPQVPVGGGQFPGKLVEFPTCQGGGTADLGGEDKEVGPRLAHADRGQPRVQRQNVHFAQHRAHTPDATAHRADHAGQRVERCGLSMLHLGQGADVDRRLAEIVARLGQFGASQLGEQRAECCREPIDDADRLFETVADFEKAVLRHGAQRAEPVRNLAEFVLHRHEGPAAGILGVPD